MRQPMTARWAVGSTVGSGLGSAIGSSIGRTTILLGLVFLIGTGIGWAITRPFTQASPQRVSTVDYVAVVAQLFQRDHNVEVARERLALLGSPPALIKQALQEAQAGKLKDPSDLAALQTLAQALASDTTGSANASTSAAGTPASTSVATPALAQANPAAASGQRTSWLGPLVAFVLAFALGVVVLLKTAGLSLSGAGIGRLSRAGPGGRSVDPVRRSADAVGAGGAAPIRRVRYLGGSKGATALATAEDEADDDGVESSPESVPLVRPIARSTPATIRPRAVEVASPRNVTFESVYHLGDDPFDEIHPILDPRSSTLVAACGLSSTLKLESSTRSRYYAFSAWVQDYASGEQLRSVGLVTRWALDAESAQIQAWVREGDVEEVLPAQAGAGVELKTGTLCTRVSVIDVEYATEGEARCFARLGVRFDVRWEES